MAQITHRANLNAAAVPMMSRLHGQTVIVREADTNYVPSVSSKADEDRDIGIPQIYYCHNVVPTPQGVSSVGYRQFTAPVVGAFGFTQIIAVRDDKGNQALIAVTTAGALYKLQPSDTGWVALDAITGTAGKMLTAAYVSGITYIYIAEIGCFTFDFDLRKLMPVTLAGLTATKILGIVSNSGYLVVWSKDAIAWSSTISATDFVPSDETGAGGGGVESARGAIVALVSSVAGFVAYTTTNAVAVSYSGNARYPFNFREIVGAGGLTDIELAVADGNTGAQYAYTTSGLQQVSFQQAQVVFPQVTDYVSGSYFEDFNETTKQFSYTRLSSPMRKKLYVVSGRYLVLSYGVSVLTHCIYYDLALKRFGKLKIDHVDVIDLSLYIQSVETAKRSIGFLKATGEIVTLDTDYLSADNEGVLITGKYQYRRSRLLQMNKVVLEEVETAGGFNLYNMPALDGKNVVGIKQGYLQSDTGSQRQYLFRDVATNHSLLFVGNFALNTIVLTFNVHGRV